MPESELVTLDDLKKTDPTFDLKPVNRGAYKLYFNKLIDHLDAEGPKDMEALSSIDSIFVKAEAIVSPRSRLNQYIAECKDFDLVTIQAGNVVRLTDLGSKYASRSDRSGEINDQQADLLLSYVKEKLLREDKGTILAILGFVSAVRELSKNKYPVPEKEIQSYFIHKVGKSTEWIAPSTIKDQTSYFGQYAQQLRLVVRTDEGKYHLTREGLILSLLHDLARVSTGLSQIASI